MNSEQQIKDANYRKNHISAVKRLAGRYIDLIRTQVKNHDADKISGLPSPKHGEKSRHHGLAFGRTDLTLVDLIETCSDCLDAGKRWGGYVDIPVDVKIMDNEYLKSIISNTIHLLQPDIKVVFTKADPANH